MNNVDLKELRLALGKFATGVTIVTTASESGEPIGVTANSFNSISLQPPMILWSLSRAALSRSAFESAGYFCVHVLTAKQRELSSHFSRRGVDKFGSTDWSWGPQSLPFLKEFSARFVCRMDRWIPIGDHVVFIGEVLASDTTDQRPLVFCSGEYALADRRIKRGTVQSRNSNVTELPTRRKT